MLNKQILITTAHIWTRIGFRLFESYLHILTFTVAIYLYLFKQLMTEKKWVQNH